MTGTIGRASPAFVGRDEQLEIFEAIRANVIGGGSAVVGVSGRPGTGKTVLMRRLAMRLDSSAFGYGKYDAVRTRPYEGIAAALTEVVAHMASTPQRVAWESELTGSLGEGAQALTSLVPELSNVIDTPRSESGAGPEANPDSEAILLALQQAVTALVLTTARHTQTVTLMIDDLQWAGRNTISLLKKLGDASVPGLLILAAWRDQEGVTPERYSGVFDETLRLDAFGRESLSELFTACTGRPPDPPVLEALETETRGNPQFVTELINQDLSDGRLRWEEEARGWVWDRAEETSDLMGGLERLLLDRLDRMPAADADLIAAAAALGTTFDAADLAAATGESTERVTELLASAAARSFLVAVDGDGLRATGRYRFAHDRIAEITARRLSPNQRKETNVRLARDLIDGGLDRASDALIHLSAATDLITNVDERVRLAWLSVDAGNDARRQAAFSIALRHFQTGLDLVPHARTDRDLVSHLSVGAAEAAWLCGDDRVGDLLRRATLDGSTLVDRARLTTVEMKLGLAGYGGLRPENALERGLKMLEELGIELPRKPTNAGVLTALLRTRKRLTEHSMQDLATLEPSDDAESIWAEQVLGEMFSTSYAVDPDLFPFVVLEAVNLTLDRGRLPMTPVALAAYGLLLVVVADNPLLEVTRPKLVTRFYREALEFGHLAMRMADFKESIRYRPWTHFLYYDFISHWHYPIRDNLDAIRAAAKEALEVGDPAYGAYLADVETSQMIALGSSMADIDRRGRAVLDTMGPGQEKQYELTEILVQLAENLATPDDSPPYVLAGSTGYDEADILSRSGEDTVSLSVLWDTKLELAVLSGHYEMAPIFADETNRYLSGLAGTTIVPFYHMLNVYGRVKAEPDKRSTKSALKTALRKYERWQEMSPRNYRSAYLLLRGLDGLLARKVEEAKRHLVEAINTSQIDQLPIVTALAHLAIADLVTDDEEPHVEAAAQIWASMGNVAGLEMLKRTYPDVSTLDAIDPEPDAMPGGRHPYLEHEASLLSILGRDATEGLAMGEKVMKTLTTLALELGNLEAGRSSATDGELRAMEAETRALVRREVERHRGWMTPGDTAALFRSVEDAALAALALVAEQTARNDRASRIGGSPVNMHLGVARGPMELDVSPGGETTVYGPAVERAVHLAATAERGGSTLMIASELQTTFANAGARLTEVSDGAETLFSLAATN